LSCLGVAPSVRLPSDRSIEHTTGSRAVTRSPKRRLWAVSSIYQSEVGVISMRLDGKIALVTGAGSGIGKCVAETYAREGARVALADINAEAARSAARTIGNSAIALRCDVSKKADIDGVVEETLAAFGGLDILVNNAGATHVNKPVLEIGEAEYDRIFAINVKGVFFACQAAVPAMRKQGGDRWIASTPGTVGLQCHQRRGPCPDQVTRGRAWPGRYPRLRHRAGRDRNATAAILSRFGARHAGKVHRHNPDGPPRSAAGYRRCGFVPGFGRGQIPHR